MPASAIKQAMCGPAQALQVRRGEGDAAPRAALGEGAPPAGGMLRSKSGNTIGENPDKSMAHALSEARAGAAADPTPPPPRAPPPPPSFPP